LPIEDRYLGLFGVCTSALPVVAGHPHAGINAIGRPALFMMLNSRLQVSAIERLLFSGLLRREPPLL